MRKKILGVTFVVAMMAVAGYNVYVNQTKNSIYELALANVEALAVPEGSGGDCEVYCTSDDNYTCIIIYKGDAVGTTCPDMRKK